MSNGNGGHWEDMPDLFADKRTPLRLQQEQILATMAARRAAGVPIIIGTDIEYQVGNVFLFWIAMRIVRVSDQAEYQLYSGSDVSEMRVPYFYEVEAMD